MNLANAAEELKKEQIAIKLYLILEQIKESYGILKYLERERKDLFYKPDLSLHKLRQYKQMADLCHLFQSEAVPVLPVLYEKKEKIDILFVNEVDFLESIQDILHIFKETETEVIKDVLLDQHIYLFKLLYAYLKK